MEPALLNYCTSQDGLIVLPIEVLSSSGLDPAAAARFRSAGVLTEFQCQRLDAMLSAYFNRAAQLAGASGQWFHPRLQHLCLVTNGVQTRPYFQPFHGSSWLLYLEDISEHSSSIELSIFLLFQAERQYLQQQIGASLMSNLGYFQVLSESQIEDFRAGCRCSTRPDAAAYQALAEALPCIRRMHHDPFRRPSVALPNHSLLANGLIVSIDQQQQLAELQDQWMASTSAVVSAHRDSVRVPGPNAGQALRQWLDRQSPQVVLTGAQGAVLWQETNQADPALDELLEQLSPDAESSIRKDLQVIDEKSKLFLDSLDSPDDLARPAAWMTEGGLSYIHASSNRIAYSLTDDPGRLWQVSPPYERQMLAARTIHEWGHQAAETGWVRVAPDRVSERKAHQQQLIALLDQTVSELPARLKPMLIAALDTGSDPAQSAGARLHKALMRRIDDYMANLLARHYLSQDEMDTYVRNNVASRALDYAPEQALMHLLRIAYEYQYLHLSSIADGWRWFMDSSWFEDLFVRPGIIGPEQFRALCDQIARICDCFDIDSNRIRIPRTGS